MEQTLKKLTTNLDPTAKFTMPSTHSGHGEATSSWHRREFVALLQTFAARLQDGVHSDQEEVVRSQTTIESWRGREFVAR